MAGKEFKLTLTDKRGLDHFGLFHRTKSQEFYKMVAGWHKDYLFNPVIYPINLSRPFMKSPVSIFIVK